MHPRSILCLVLAASLSPATIAAAPFAPPLPANVESLATGGYWELGDKRGRVRVVVRNFGWEHVHSEVSIDWIEEDPTTSSLRVYKTAQVTELNDGSWSVGQVTLNYVSKKAVFSFEAARSGADEDVSYLLHVDAPGKYRLAKKR